MSRVRPRHSHHVIQPHRNVVCRTALLMALASLATTAHANDDWKIGGDVRAGYVASETRARSGQASSIDSARARLRLNLRGDLGNGWRVGGRVAARVDTNQDGMEFWLKPNAPSPTGLNDGQATIDEAYVEYRPAQSPWSVRVGRFQASFTLADIMKKTLDQNDSPNFDITWTDGAWVQHRGSEWTTHLIVRYNDRHGPGNTLRPPLEFSDGGSRAGLFAAVESTAAKGPLVQRMLTMTWLPSALHPLGVANPAVEDYFAVTAKATAQWPLGEGATKFRLGGELGYAPNTPRRQVMGSGTGDASALSWQASFNVIDVMPRHDIGVVYGRIADGWLISNDFRPNNSLLEARWVWRIGTAWQVDARFRRRQDIDLPAGTRHARRDDDVYVRTTFRF